MSRVERTDEESARQAARGRRGETPRADPNRQKPSKAEGEESDIEQALENQKE